MKINNKSTEEQIKNAIENLKCRNGGTQFTTKDVVKEKIGFYRVNNPINKETGKKIKELGYSPLPSINIKDDDGKNTTTTVFEFKNID